MAERATWLPTRSELEGELVSLCKGPGLTMPRLEECGAVIQACSGDGEAVPPLDTVRDRLLSALYTVRKTKQGQALWAALGIDPASADNLQQRRSDYGKVVKKMPGTLAGWEKVAISDLALRLLTRYHGAPPLPSELAIPHGGFLIRALQVVARIKDRIFVESTQTRTLLSLVDGAGGFVYGTYSPTILSDPVGCTIEPPRHFPGGTHHNILFSPKLNRGDVHTFSFRETEPMPEHPEPPLQDFSGQSFESPTKHYRVEVHFEGEQPPVVWGYRQLSRIERPGRPEDGIAIPMTKDGVVSLHVTDLLAGLCSGIAWRWEP